MMPTRRNQRRQQPCVRDQQPPKLRRKKYTEQEIQCVLETTRRNMYNGNWRSIADAARQLGLPDSTLRRWHSVYEPNIWDEIHVPTRPKRPGPRFRLGMQQLQQAADLLNSADNLCLLMPGLLNELRRRYPGEYDVNRDTLWRALVKNKRLLVQFSVKVVKLDKRPRIHDQGGTDVILRERKGFVDSFESRHDPVTWAQDETIMYADEAQVHMHVMPRHKYTPIGETAFVPCMSTKGRAVSSYVVANAARVLAVATNAYPAKDLDKVLEGVPRLDNQPELRRVPRGHANNKSTTILVAHIIATTWQASQIVRARLTELDPADGPLYEPVLFLYVDNLAIHRNEEMKMWFDRVNIRLHYLPRYSSPMNPVETVFAWGKNKLGYKILEMVTQSQSHRGSVKDANDVAKAFTQILIKYPSLAFLMAGQITYIMKRAQLGLNIKPGKRYNADNWNLGADDRQPGELPADEFAPAADQSAVRANATQPLQPMDAVVQPDGSDYRVRVQAETVYVRADEHSVALDEVIDVHAPLVEDAVRSLTPGAGSEDAASGASGASEDEPMSE